MAKVTTKFGISVSWGGSISSLENSSYSKKYLSNELVRVCRNSQTLWQHIKNDHKERTKASQKRKRSFAKQS